MILRTSTSFPTDIRVEKEARALCGAGFDVAILCQRVSPDEASRETLDYGLAIHRADIPPRGALARIASSYRWALTGTLFHRGWVGPIRRFIDDFRPDVLHCHDLSVLPTVLAVADERGLPVVGDAHENYPELRAVYEATTRPLRRLRLRLIGNTAKWRRLEGAAFGRCRRVIAVGPESARPFTEHHGIPESRIVLVRNTEDETTFDVHDADPAIVERYAGAWVASYVGHVAPLRGIDVAIRAAPLAAARIPGFRLVVVGVRGKYGRGLARVAEQAGASACVELVDYVPFDRVPSYMAASRVCLAPFGDYAFTQLALPHKLFQYMMAGKPVAVSDCAPLKRVVEDADAGLVFRAGDPEDLARCLIAMHDAGDGQLARWGANGRRAALGPYAWRHDARRLVELYRDLAAELGLGAPAARAAT